MVFLLYLVHYKNEFRVYCASRGKYIKLEKEVERQTKQVFPKICQASLGSLSILKLSFEIKMLLHWILKKNLFTIHQ